MSTWACVSENIYFTLSHDIVDQNYKFMNHQQKYLFNRYFENALILEEDKAPHRALISSFTVIAHELAHQFFGNLVTCEWWSQIWLNGKKSISILSFQ